MDGTQAGYFPFLAIGLSRDGLSLRTIRAFSSAAPLLLHCRGIEVGRRQLDGPLREGAVIDIPVERLPRVPLPAELRLSTAPDAADLVAPWRIESAEVALSLLGAPDLRIEDLRLDHGVLRGTGREARNGLLDPVLYARINGSGARIVGTEPPIALPEGGCAFRLSVPILPTDLTESGLSVTLMLVGQDAPAASIAWGRSGIGEAERRLIELEGRIRQMEDEAAASQQALQATLQRQLALQQDRIDAFIAAASTLLLDRLAAAPGREPDALRALLETAGPAQAGDPVLDVAARRLAVPPEAALFGTGWHREEIYPSGSFRWMGPRGLLLNPAPDRAVASVTLDICHLYRASLPSVTAQMDAAAAEVTVAEAGGGFTVRLTHPEGPQPLRLLRLASLTGGSPAEDGAGSDRRQLSFAVSRVVFEYAD
ncbi:hypothetical protein E2C06_04170 [Dankookia rubra]|uniref:Uncharacterized protein n=1 Tax=Dankookia rubra TaxID=1442381 RepID=A0A4R5QKN2_9PROT|nr:hypothetical protein [Dankookia rubra]TDH64022.1 hypothetical protein E2C06_04170 [Dankookia rubra]